MNNLLFLDTETTGFAKSGAHNQAGQARLCQIGLVLTDAQGNIKAQFGSLVKPNGWFISDGAYDCHGISIDDCEIHGLPISVVMNIYYWFMHKTNICVAHNFSFDKRIMEIEEAWDKDCDTDIYANKKEWYCTQEKTVNICKIPPTAKMKKAGRNHYKTPSLTEAYKYFMGKDMENAHDAISDAIACKDIFFAVQQNVAQPSGKCYNYNIRR